MQCIAPRIRRRVRGQAMVEMALVLPLLMLLMVGIIQLVLIGNVALSVSRIRVGGDAGTRGAVGSEGE